MTLGGIIILLLLLVSLIAFIYFIVVTARGWGALHTTLLCFLFIECWVFMVFAAGVQSSRVKATKNAMEQKARAERAESETQNLLWGSFNADSNELNAVVPVQRELRRMTSDRGRVWRGVQLIQSNQNDFQLELTGVTAPVADDLTAEPVEAADAGAPSSESIPENLVVYAFAEEVDAEGIRIPNYYLGEYTVTQSQDGAITLNPTLPLTANQRQFLQGGGGSTWTLYESLPLDSHRAFAASGSKESDSEIFGRMDEETITELFADIPDEGNRRQDVIDDYLHDGQPATDEDPAESIWVQVNMLKSQSFDVDSQQVANLNVGSFFDSLGRAVDARLQLEDEDAKGNVTLGTSIRDNLIVFKEAAARSLIDAGAAELVQRIYVRPLNDYEQAFNNHTVRMKDVEERIGVYQRETELLNAANQNTQQVITAEQLEFDLLNSDLANYRKEISVLESEVSEAETALATLQSKLSNLFQLVQSSAAK